MCVYNDHLVYFAIVATSKKRLTWHQARVSKPSIQDLVMDTMKVGSLVYLTGSLISPASVSKVDAYNPIVMIG